MTQLQMTNAELNRALAVLMGKWIGDCCHDPSASLEVQAAAIAKDAREYERNLAVVTWPEGGAKLISWDGPRIAMSPVGLGKLLTATPRQRAEAAYMTIQGAQG